MSEKDDDATTVPFGSFATFWNYVTGLTGSELPTHFDRSLLVGKSGTDQKVILAGLKFFDLIDSSDNKIDPGLAALADAAPEERNRILESLLQTKYTDAFGVSEANGSPQQLHESFEQSFGVTGDTRRKAATFFLHAAKQAEISVSPNFTKVRSGSGRVKRAATGAKKSAKKRASTKTTTASGGSEYELSLESGGEIRVSIDVDLMVLMRHAEDREFVMALVDSLETYAANATTTDADTSKDDEDDPEDGDDA